MVRKQHFKCQPLRQWRRFGPGTDERAPCPLRWTHGKHMRQSPIMRLAVMGPQLPWHSTHRWLSFPATHVFFLLADAFLFSFAAELPHIIVNARTLRKPFPTFVAINVQNFPCDVWHFSTFVPQETMQNRFCQLKAVGHWWAAFLE